MLRWYFNGRVPVMQINERGRFMGFRDPGMDPIRGACRPLCRARARRCQSGMGVDDRGKQQPLEQVRARLARHRDGHLRAGKTDRLDAGAFAAAGLAALRWRVLAGES